jgi:hypothetical protein
MEKLKFFQDFRFILPIMGIYSIIMGKGVILPIIDFANLLCCEKIFDVEDVPSGLRAVSGFYLGFKYTVTFLPHDAFDMNDNMDLMMDSENRKQMESIIEWKSKKIELCFVGVCKTIKAPGEFSYRVETPELLYGLSALLPHMMKLYPKLEAEKCTELRELLPEYTPRIWTFAGDCHCCT